MKFPYVECDELRQIPRHAQSPVYLSVCMQSRNILQGISSAEGSAPRPRASCNSTGTGTVQVYVRPVLVYCTLPCFSHNDCACLCTMYRNCKLLCIKFSTQVSQASHTDVLTCSKVPVAPVIYQICFWRAARAREKYMYWV